MLPPFDDTPENIGAELRSIVESFKAKDAKQILDELFMLHKEDMVVAASNGFTSYQLPYDEASHVAHDLYVNARVIIPYVIQKYNVNLNVLQGGLNEAIDHNTKIEFSWASPSSPNNCNFSMVE